MARLTPVVIVALKQLEGLPGGHPALKPYQDIAGVWTNGFGNTHGVTANTAPITDEQAEADLIANASEYALAVDSYATVPLTDNQRDALILFAFNEGVEAFRTSTLLRLLNAGDYDSVPVQLMRWVYAKNKKTGKKEISNGLVNRRTAEAALWKTPNSVQQIPAPALAFDTHSSGPADVPPSPTNVAQTSTGKLQIGALATGGAAAIVQGYQQAQPILSALQSAVASTATLPQWLKLASVLLIVASMAFAGFSLWEKARKVKEENPS